MRKLLFISFLLIVSSSISAQKIMTPEESQQLQTEYNNSWKIYEIIGDSVGEYTELMTKNFFIGKIDNYGFYLKESEELQFVCCWKKIKNRIIFSDNKSTNFEFQIIVWTKEQLTLSTMKNPKLEIKFKN